MKHTKRINLILLLLCFSSSHTTNTYRLGIRKKAKETIPQSKNQVIIFDATNVLFQENKNGFIERLGFGKLTSYTLTHWKNPGYVTLDTLNKISQIPSQKPPLQLTISGRLMPRCIFELQQGKKTCTQAKKKIEKYIAQLAKEKYFSSEKEQKLVQEIMDLILNPNEASYLTKPVKPMIKIVQKLKSEGYKLYLIGNVPQEIYASLDRDHNEILQLFDGIVISSHVNLVKPDTKIFEHLLSTYRLKPNQCVLIDEQEESIQVAQELGMKGIIYNKPQKVTQKMKQYGIVV